MAKDNAAVVVFTADTREKILHEGGSGDWVVSAKKADSCKYIVCCRKPNWSNRKEGISARAAFLIGRVAGLRERPDSGNDRDQMRYLIQMGRYRDHHPRLVYHDRRYQRPGLRTINISIEVSLR